MKGREGNQVVRRESATSYGRGKGLEQGAVKGPHLTLSETPGAQVGAPPSGTTTHCVGVQGKNSGNSMPSVTNKAIRMQGSAILPTLLPCAHIENPRKL
jgi:hypothetical protein